MFTAKFKVHFYKQHTHSHSCWWINYYFFFCKSVVSVGCCRYVQCTYLILGRHFRIVFTKIKNTLVGDFIFISITHLPNFVELTCFVFYFILLNCITVWKMWFFFLSCCWLKKKKKKKKKQIASQWFDVFWYKSMCCIPFFSMSNFACARAL